MYAKYREEKEHLSVDFVCSCIFTEGRGCRLQTWTNTGSNRHRHWVEKLEEVKHQTPRYKETHSDPIVTPWQWLQLSHYSLIDSSRQDQTHALRSREQTTSSAVNEYWPMCNQHCQGSTPHICLFVFVLFFQWPQLCAIFGAAQPLKLS